MATISSTGMTESTSVIPVAFAKNQQDICHLVNNFLFFKYKNLSRPKFVETKLIKSKKIFYQTYLFISEKFMH